MNNEHREIFKEIGEFLNSRYAARPVAGPVVASLLQTHEHLAVDITLGRFYNWILVQALPLCRAPYTPKGDMLEILNALFQKVPCLSQLFTFEDEKIDLRLEDNPSVIEDLRAVIFETYIPDVGATVM